MCVTDNFAKFLICVWSKNTTAEMLFLCRWKFFKSESETPKTSKYLHGPECPFPPWDADHSVKNTRKPLVISNHGVLRSSTMSPYANWLLSLTSPCKTLKTLLKLGPNNVLFYCITVTSVRTLTVWGTLICSHMVYFSACLDDSSMKTQKPQKKSRILPQAP